MRGKRENSEAAQPMLGGGETGDEQLEQRTLHILDHDANRQYKFKNNSVATNKYSLFIWSWNFLIWKNLFEQFHKAANVYFLGVSAFQVVPTLSPTGKYTTLGPLILVLALTLIKDAWEDWKRRVADRDVNNRMGLVFRNNDWKSVPWKDIEIGDIVCLSKNNPIPADLIILWSSEGEGLCYIETSSLDGETNLKLRKSPTAAYQFLRKQQFSAGLKVPSPGLLQGKVVCEMPNERLYHFDGYFEREEFKKREQRAPLVADNVLLRGAVIRNTDYILGVAIFTGDDTKLMHNSVNKGSKASRMDGVTNRQILFVFLFQLALSIFSAILHHIYSGNAEGTHWYLPQGDQSANTAKAFITFMILLNSLIPISLYVMLEVVKLVQASLINNDIQMYCGDRDLPAVVRSSKLNEELGQVEYIFSDKTGTLTCNMMEFRKFSCTHTDADRVTTVESYGESNPLGEDHMHLPSGSHAPSSPLMSTFSFYDSRVNKGMWKTQRNREEILFLLQAMAVCHTVIPEKDSDGAIRFQASSPDEMCLTKAARSLGVELLARTENTVTIREDGELKRWEILNVIEFSSARKRMSVICRDPHGRLLLIVKGADSVLLERVRRDPSVSAIVERTQSILSTFAGDGLRTLVFAKADLAEDVYKRWRRKFDSATTAIHEREEKIYAVAEEIEKELDLIGTTAIEDKLQENVPQTIELLSKAGIKLWVLTGDKQETALNIGYACSLLHSNMGLFTFDDCTGATIRHALEKYVNDIEAAAVESGQEIGLIIQGTMLQYLLPTNEDPLANENETDWFVTLATKCKAVICCRVSPMQKAQVVQAVKDRVTGVTLAIGDGANDVSMLQTAHVGVGITGLEGLQAARSSDYSFAYFQSLSRLLLVHGRWSYRRIAKLIVFTFYKNMSLYMTQFWFSLFNRFTGQSLYDAWALATYNLAFTAFPIMALACLDRDVEAKRIMSVNQFPELYVDGIKNKLFNTKEFWTYTVTALIHSAMCFYLPMLSWGDLTQPGTGRSFGTIGHAVAAYTSVLLVVTVKCGLETNAWTILNWAMTFFSVYVWYLFLFFYCSLWKYVQTFPDFANWYGADTPVLAMPTYWLVVIVVVSASLMRDITWKYWRRNYNPALGHCVQLFETAQTEGSDFDRYDVKRAYPWLFPKHEVKTFKPTLSEGVGHHRFKSADSMDREMSEISITRSESQFFSPGTKPGRRTGRISAIIEEDL